MNTNTPPSRRLALLTQWSYFGFVAGALSLLSLLWVPKERDDIAMRTQTHARLLARALAHAAVSKDQIDAKGSQKWIDTTIQALRNRAPLKEALILAEKQGGDFDFLRETLFVAHSQKSRQNQKLNKENDRDKELFDLTQNIEKLSKTQPHATFLQTFPAQKEMLAAAPVLSSQGALLGTAVVRIPWLKPLPQKGWPALWTAAFSWILGLLLVGLGLFIVPGRWNHIFPLLGLLGASLYPFVDAVERTQQRRIQRLEHQRDLLVRVLSNTPKTTADWRKATLPRNHSAFEFASPTQISVHKIHRQARPGEVKATPYITLGVAGWLLYLLYGLGWVGQLVRTVFLHRAAYLYTFPAMFGMLLLVFLPFTVGIGLSFFKHTGGGNYTFVGLAHFREILSGQLHPFPNPLNFYFTLTVTILWTVLNVALHVSIGLSLALLLKNPLLRMKEVYRVLLILPWAIPNYITALIWKGMFHQQFGAINAFREALGMAKVQWFSEFSTAFTANLVTNTWLGFPFMMVVALGALQSIPEDLYEAADVDGANRWQKFWHITLPLLKPALFPAIILGSIWTFNMFNVIYLVSNGGPEGSTDILITEAYNWAFVRGNRYGYAAAYSVIVFLILLTYSLATNRITKATEGVFRD